MPEVQHLYDALIFLDLVVNENRGVHQLTHAGPSADEIAHVRKAGEQIQMIE